MRPESGFRMKLVVNRKNDNNPRVCQHGVNIPISADSGELSVPN